MTTAFPFLIVLFFCSPVVAQDLPPDMLADQYPLEATEAMEQGELVKAVRAFEKIEALEVEPPPLFAYFYGKLLAEHGVGPEVWRKGQALLKQFVISAGRALEYYTPAPETAVQGGRQIGGSRKTRPIVSQDEHADGAH